MVGEFQASGSANNGVILSFHTPAYEHWWYLDFAPPQGEQLAPGMYLNATRYPFEAADVPGLSVSGDGRGCNQLTGSFRVVEASYSPGGALQYFWAAFEQFCDSDPYPLRGDVRYFALALPSLFYTVPPCRLLDTRLSDGPYGGPSIPGGAGLGRQFKISGTCGVPDTANSISLNVTVVSRNADNGSIRVFPGNLVEPAVETQLYQSGSTRATNRIVQLASDGSGTIEISNWSLLPVDVVLDVNGYFQ